MNAPAATDEPLFDSLTVSQRLGVCERQARYVLLAAERLGILVPAGTIQTGRPGRPRKLWTITTAERSA